MCNYNDVHTVYKIIILWHFNKAFVTGFIFFWYARVSLSSIGFVNLPVTYIFITTCIVARGRLYIIGGCRW
jgi:hypothetical protein